MGPAEFTSREGTEIRTGRWCARHVWRKEEKPSKNGRVRVIEEPKWRAKGNPWREDASLGTPRAPRPFHLHAEIVLRPRSLARW